MQTIAMESSDLSASRLGTERPLVPASEMLGSKFLSASRLGTYCVGTERPLVPASEMLGSKFLSASRLGTERPLVPASEMLGSKFLSKFLYLQDILNYRNVDLSDAQKLAQITEDLKALNDMLETGQKVGDYHDDVQCYLMNFIMAFRAVLREFIKSPLSDIPSLESTDTCKPDYKGPPREFLQVKRWSAAATADRDTLYRRTLLKLVTPEAAALEAPDVDILPEHIRRLAYLCSASLEESPVIPHDDLDLMRRICETDVSSSKYDYLETTFMNCGRRDITCNDYLYVLHSELQELELRYQEIRWSPSLTIWKPEWLSS